MAGFSIATEEIFYQPHPLYPPLHSWRGGRKLKRGAKPLLNAPLGAGGRKEVNK
jgi:hypothetical protein